MSNVHFNIFEDNKENSRSQNALVNKTKECKLKTISGNENQENPNRKALTTEEFLKDKKVNLLKPSVTANQNKIVVVEKPANPADLVSSSCPSENTANEDLETTTYRDNEDVFDKTVVETPISVAKEAQESPMSIDNSLINKSAPKIPYRPPFDHLFAVSNYQKDIYEYLKKVEIDKNFKPKSDYMRKQPDINDSMRTILVDWLVEVSEEYRLNGETLYLAVNYIDRFLSFMSVVRAKLQLVGATAILLAAKFEEIYPPEVSEFVYICDDTYTKQQILRMEKLILKVLSFDLGSASPLNFLNLFSCMFDVPENVLVMAKYLCELTLLKASPFLNFRASQISAAALAMSFYNYGFAIWSCKMRNATGYEIEHLKELILHLNQIHCGAEEMQQQAIQEKYKTNKNLQVSNVIPKQLDQYQLDDLISAVTKSDILNTTDENIESVRKAFQLVN